MKTLGLIGGMSWESTAIYYRRLNEQVRDRLGGLHSARLVLFSFDFAEMEALQSTGDWQAAGHRMVEAATALERAGAQCLIICTNTMHKLAPAIQAESALPLLHIADATADAMARASISRPLLLATRYTMEEDFYKGLLARQGFDVRTPNCTERGIVHDVIYDELCRGIVDTRSRQAYQSIISRMIRDEQIDAVIFGCTEVGLLIDQGHVAVPVFDTTELHIAAATGFSLGQVERQ
ncbi:MAG: aspartate/glutamate racemase family protein [Granulosicoccus sp.]|nr:aspartate/glutamate racemase family protein [Granulosicoccus sp.]